MTESSSLDIGPRAKRKCEVRTYTVAYISQVMAFSIPNKIKKFKNHASFHILQALTKNEKNIKYIKEKLTTFLYPNHDTLSFDY